MKNHEAEMNTLFASSHQQTVPGAVRELSRGPLCASPHMCPSALHPQGNTPQGLGSLSITSPGGGNAHVGLEPASSRCPA